MSCNFSRTIRLKSFREHSANFGHLLHLLRRCNRIPIDGGDVISDAGSCAQKSVSRNDAQIPISDLVETVGFDQCDTDSWGFCQASSNIEDPQFSTRFGRRVFIFRTLGRLSRRMAHNSTCADQQEGIVACSTPSVLPAVPRPTII